MYTIAVEEEEEEIRHVKWRDVSTHKPLVQHTPPPSKPLHRESVALKPCIESPDLATKEQLEQQRLKMVEQQRTFYLEQIEKKHARLF